MIKENCKINASRKSKLTEYYDEETMNIINELFHDDFEQFGYEKFTNLEQLNAYLENIEINENLRNKELLEKYQYKGNDITEEDVIENIMTFLSKK